MFGRRCLLCNGKLDSRNICKECGLDNTKSDKYYKMNRSSCDDMPLTHVHEETKKKDRNASVKSRKTSVHTQRNKKTAASIISILAIIISIGASIVGLLTESYDIKPDYDVEEVYDPYEYVDKVHPQVGEYAEYAFTSGDYIVGIHLPEGDYEAVVTDGFDIVEVKDNDNGIYLYEYEEKSGGNHLDNLRLFNGAIVTINTRTVVELKTFNAQYQNMGISLENPLNECYIFEQGDVYVAGQAFDAGVYNLQAVTDVVYVYITYVEDGETWHFYSGLELGKDSERGAFYKNVVIPEGATVWCEEGSVELIPAEMVGDMDYSRYYW